MSTEDVVVKLSEASRALNQRTGNGDTKARGQLLSLAFFFFDLAKRVRGGVIVVPPEQKESLLAEIDDVLVACTDAGAPDAQIIVEANEVLSSLTPTIMFAAMARYPAAFVPSIPNGLTPAQPDFDPPIS